jgi:hypothetical protein
MFLEALTTAVAFFAFVGVLTVASFAFDFVSWVLS